MQEKHQDNRCNYDQNLILGDGSSEKIKTPPHRNIIASCAAASDEYDGVSQHKGKPDRDDDERRSRGVFPPHRHPHSLLHENTEQYGCKYRDKKSCRKMHVR